MMLMVMLVVMRTKESVMMRIIFSDFLNLASCCVTAVALLSACCFEIFDFSVWKDQFGDVNRRSLEAF